MPNTDEPYGYIKMEIERLKYVAQKARDEAAMLINEADTHLANRCELELALEKQIKNDSD